jgi:TonB family protein
VPLRLAPVPVILPDPVPPQVIDAPVLSVAAGPVDVAGMLKQLPASSPTTFGPGSGGGIGTGAGTGLGEGRGAGVGPGSGGGTGDGPFKPGTGITPPTLIREVKPLYTDDARRRAVEGDVVLEIIVRRDGSVGNVRVLQSLGAGLEQKAIEAVRQWRFGPARRQGQPVDVVVEVSVEFTLR